MKNIKKVAMLANSVNMFFRMGRGCWGKNHVLGQQGIVQRSFRGEGGVERRGREYDQWREERGRESEGVWIKADKARQRR